MVLPQQVKKDSVWINTHFDWRTDEGSKYCKVTSVTVVNGSVLVTYRPFDYESEGLGYETFMTYSHFIDKYQEMTSWGIKVRPQQTNIQIELSNRLSSFVKKVRSAR